MTRLIEILISLAIVAALFLIVGLVLPSSRYLVMRRGVGNSAGRRAALGVAIKVCLEFYLNI